MSKISLLQQVEPKHWAGLTKQMHLAWAGYTKDAAYVDELLENIYEVNYGDDNIVSLANKFDTHYVDQETYKWMLQGSDERTIPLIKATTMVAGTETEITATSTIQPGLNGQPIFLYFPEKWFSAPATIAGDHPEDYQVRIQTDPQQAGASQWKYTTVAFGSSFIPVEELLSGTRWSNMYAAVEREFSKRGSDMNFATHFTLQNTMSCIRKSYTAPGSVIKMGQNIPLAMAFQGADGKKVYKWIDKLGWEFYKACRREKAKLLIFGKSTIDPATGQSTVMGESGNPVITGYGLMQQMEGSNIAMYNNFSIDAFTDFLTQISFNKIPEDKRKFLVSTGTFGLTQFHKAASQKMSQISYLRSDHNIKMVNGKVQLDEGQIMSVKSLNGIEISLMYDPMLDSPTVLGKVQHPNGGPVSSYIYNIWDIGTTNGKPNIQKVAIKGDEEYTSYVPGLRDPFTPGSLSQNMTMAAHGVDTYEVHKMYNASIMLRNPLKAARYIPNIYKAV